MSGVEDLQLEHERRMAADPSHDRSSCYCCCLDCEDLVDTQLLPSERGYDLEPQTPEEFRSLMATGTPVEVVTSREEYLERSDERRVDQA